MTGLVVCLAACLCTVMPDASPAQPPKNPPVGKTVDDIYFKDVWYSQRSLDDLGEKNAYVIVATNGTAPNASATLKELKRLDELYRDRDVSIISLNVDPKDSLRDIASRNLSIEGAYILAKDDLLDAAKALGMTVVPEAIVLDRDRTIRYRGAVFDAGDKQKTQGGDHQAPLQAAIEDLLAHRDVRCPTTEAIGKPIRFEPPHQPDKRTVTYSGEIASVLARHCEQCHQPGTEAPFSLSNYDDASSHAEMMTEVIRDGRMPPWYANGGHFSNEDQLSDREKQLVDEWVSEGCPPGEGTTDRSRDETDNHPSWRIDKPDLVLQVPVEHEIPADGFVPYRYLLLPHLFKEDVWFDQMEVLPDNPRVVHHCNVYYAELGRSPLNGIHFLFGRVPGSQPLRCDAEVAGRIPKGSLIGLQIHYTTTGKPEKCRISVGFHFPRTPVQKELHNLWVKNDEFSIPPGAPFYRVTADNTLPNNSVGVGIFAHMHLRGRDMSLIAYYPDGAKETLLEVPNYSFDWQLIYRWMSGSKRLPAGTRIECVAHYDNSSFNPYNPDPSAAVTVGDQSFQEMLNGVLFYVDESEHLNLSIDPDTGAADKSDRATPKQ